MAPSDERWLEQPKIRPSDGTRDAIRAAVAEDICPVRASSLRRRLLWVLAGALVAAIVVVASYGPMGWQAAADAHTAGLALLVAVMLTTVAVALCFAPASQNALGAVGRGVLAVALVFGWSIYIGSMMIGSTSFTVDGAGLMCALRGGGGGVIVGAAMMWIWRGSNPWTPRGSGAVIGAAAGCIGAAAVGLACSSPHAGHLAVGHWATVPLLALSGAAIARRVLQP